MTGPEFRLMGGLGAETMSKLSKETSSMFLSWCFLVFDNNGEDVTNDH